MPNRRPRLLPRVLTGLRARLVLGFLLVVAIVLALMFATLPRLLDGYFAQQVREDLGRRSGEIRQIVISRLTLYQSAGVEAPRAILQPTDPLTVAPGLAESFGTAEDGYVFDSARTIAQANVTITIAPDQEHADQIVYRLAVPLPDEYAQPGQQREAIIGDAYTFTFSDRFWTQTDAAPERLVTVILSDPFTYRAQTIETIVGVMGVAAVLALIAAVILSLLIADRLANPIRRLTGAARELSEGHLDTRVPPPGNSPEMNDLTAAFNAMAERVQDSIEFIRRDRDRSRDFLADVSHELRTPIAALRTFNELLTEGQVPDKATRQEFLEQSRLQIERLDWLASNLLELSKLDSGLVLLDLRPDDLRAVVENAVQQAQPSADRKGVKLEVHVPDEPLRQRHDPQRMGQVLGNLVGNAIKFTPAGGKVDISLGPTDGGTEFRVTDTGVGIDARELPYVFDRFYRGTQAVEPRATGSGLGLSIVRSIVEMHNGRVAVTSTPGVGTQVSVLLPADVSVSSPAPARA
ncbi:MAG: two-component system, OmpR family, sensor kinase [Chloroflexota bacterium]|jgi:signal transduction histidine kinase|nr:two-component system, OmpR family, sensor kinase [Chloroflexota bacterium]